MNTHIWQSLIISLAFPVLFLRLALNFQLAWTRRQCGFAMRIMRIIVTDAKFALGHVQPDPRTGWRPHSVACATSASYTTHTLTSSPSTVTYGASGSPQRWRPQAQHGRAVLPSQLWADPMSSCVLPWWTAWAAARGPAGNTVCSGYLQDECGGNGDHKYGGLNAQ